MSARCAACAVRVQAFAKYCGGYDMLNGGHTAWALNALTGSPVFRLKRYDFADGAWRRLDVTTQSDAGKKSMGFLPPISSAISMAIFMARSPPSPEGATMS